MRFIPGFLLFVSVALTTACGGDSAIDDTRKKPNSFASVKNPANDFSQTSTGDSDNTVGLASDEIRITMELPGSLAPDGELTRRNLRIVQPDSVRAYKINNTLQEVGTVSYALRQDDEGYTVISFENGQPLSPDVIIEAQYGNTTLRSLATDADRDIKINPFSEYLLRNTLPKYSPGEFQRLVDCADETRETLCLNKLVWPALADQVHDFEINIPTETSIAGALELLAQRADLASYIASAAGYPLLDDQSTSNISANSAEYNSVFMGLELGQTFLESSLAGSGQWGIRMGREKPTSQTTYLYPGSTLSSLEFLGIKTTSLAAQIPYDRKTLIHKNTNEFFHRGADFWTLNTHEASPGAATLDSDTRLLALRALYQSITDRDSSRIIGWTRNPYYLDAFVSGPGDANTGLDRTLGGYFSAGKAIELKSEQGRLARKDELEAHYVSALELNLMQQSGFDASALNGNEYNTIYLALRFSDSAPLSSGPSSSTPPMQIESGSGWWQIGAGSGSSTITQTQAYTTLTRDSSGAVLAGAAVNHSDSWTLSSRIARLSSGDKNIGRLNLDVNNPAGLDQPDLGIGASVPDGSFMAFNLMNAATTAGVIGDGLLVAAEQASGAPTSGRYRVQGFALGMIDGFNRLIHLDNGTLVLFNETGASLSSATFEVLHSVNDETVSTPKAAQLVAPWVPGPQDPQPVPEEDLLVTPLTYSSDLGKGKVSFSAGTLSLEGFVTADQSQFFLLYEDTINGEERRGLLMATKLP
ncbi:hypothetical protein [Marinobacter salexigens]|uniref:hypothetical protein n=1 Tax=Marinobacter salexigens TaxID=1925763 RepID=UPI000C28CEFF|nr:hypothetical protein [Marinobacter salexigens]